MCTVSVVATAGGYQLISNRDERRSRPAAAPPRTFSHGTRRAVWPVDGAAGGTWVGVNDAGMTLALLNRHPAAAGHVRASATSRGAIVPQLLSSASLDRAIERLQRLLADHVFAPFTLVLIHEDQLASAAFDGTGVALATNRLSRPRLFTSSSLGDDFVARPRAALFHRMVIASKAPAREQAAFHLHQWSSHPAVSVRMSRPDAATVSVTRVRVSSRHAHVHYIPLRP